jgi:hypothetical protein
MQIEIISSLANSDQLHIYNIWNSVYPTQVVFVSKNDFKSYLDKANNQKHFIYRNDDTTIGGWLMTFTRNDDRYFVLLVSEKKKKNGIGTILIEEMKKSEDIIMGWVVELNTYIKSDGTLYHSPVDFYKRSGFIITDEKCEENNFSIVKIMWQRNQ